MAWAILLVSLGVALGALAVWLAPWWARGRRTAAAAAASDAPQPRPPSDLPAGLAGVLLRERATMRDLMATVLDLGRQGYLRIEEVKVPHSVQLGVAHDDFEYTRLEAGTPAPYEQQVLDLLFAGRGPSVRLSDLQQDLAAGLPPVGTAMYRALIVRGLLARDPGAGRRRQRNQATFVLVLAAVVAYLAVIGAGDGSLLWVGSVALALAAVGGLVTAGLVSYRTAAGTAEAASWRAFARDLPNAVEREGPAVAAQHFGDYLPYAVALGVDVPYADQFAAIRSQMATPTYYFPWGWASVADGAGADPAALAARPGGPAHPPPGDWLPGLNRRVTRELQPGDAEAGPAARPAEPLPELPD